MTDIFDFKYIPQSKEYMILQGTVGMLEIVNKQNKTENDQLTTAVKEGNKHE